MASDLDSFFAKKEKRRQKKGFNKATALDLGRKIADNIERQNLDDEARDKEKMIVTAAVREAEQNLTASGEIGGAPPEDLVASTTVSDTDATKNNAAVSGDDDGWIIVDQQSEKDLMSDLKIGEMSLADPIIELSSNSSQRSNDSKDSSFDDQLCNEILPENSDNRVAKQKDNRTAANPWGTVTAEESTSSVLQEENSVSKSQAGPVYQPPVLDVRIKDQKMAAEQAKGADNTYIPVHMRKRPGGAGGRSMGDGPSTPSPSLVGRVMSRKVAPDFSNEEMFPSLSGQSEQPRPAVTYVNNRELILSL